MRKLLDFQMKNILVMASRESKKFLIVFKLVSFVHARKVFEMCYRQPVTARMYKQYLITISVDGGVIEIRDVIANEGNLIFTLKSSNVIGETLCVMYNKIFIWERNAIIVLFLKNLEEQYGVHGFQKFENLLDVLQLNSTRIARSIKELFQL